MEAKRGLHYSDIFLVPKLGTAYSRSECDVSAKLGYWEFKLPLIISNMPTLMNRSLARDLAAKGYFYIMHRFADDLEEFTSSFVNYMHQNGQIASISLGVTNESYTALKRLHKRTLYPEFITIDVAHGHSMMVRDFIYSVRKYFPNVFLIAGNVGSLEGAKFLEKLGVDAIKAGIGSGNNCRTAQKTGFYTPMFSLVRECINTNPILIADGGIRSPGDIAKAVVAGADWVMAGSLFAGFRETSGPVIQVEGKNYKYHTGSSSAYVKGENKHVEGTGTLHELKTEGLFDFLEQVEQDLQSAVSYGGGMKLEDLHAVQHGVV